MDEKKRILTASGLRALKEELHELKGQGRKDIAQKIKEAREQGDLSENAEYDAAKEEQRAMETRIEELENIIKNAEVVDESSYDKDVVGIGSIVRFYDINNNYEEQYLIVGSTEANFREKKISNESPVGKALIGGRVGDEVVAETPGGEERFKILEILREEE
ncbi:MAG: transcription elongation factor GreA [Eubacterium sp.]|nr:transcription elongation factor GreA [Eubacterium sp.]